jgi:beta-glucosidase
LEDGKGTSIWDTWAHVPGHILDGQTGDVAVDHYNRYEEDIDLIADMNMDSYRFSISWTRIFPNGTGPHVNPEGVAHYNRVIDALVSRGLKPFVTLFHWDLPETLQDSYGGWLSDQSVIDFAAYAEACFAAFGDRVKHWVTFNEPGQFTHGYGGSDKAPPGRNSNPSTEPYIAAHHILLAHAAAVDVYRRLFKAEQKGEIGITVDCEWGEPLTNSTADIEAAHRRVVFQIGWFVDPLYFGDYPAVMRELVGSRLPQFSPNQVSLIKGSLDFVGLNHYTSRWVTAGPGPSSNQESTVSLDQYVNLLCKSGNQRSIPKI